MSPTKCLEADALIELAEKGRKAADYDARMDHVALCATCSETLRTLKAFNAVDVRGAAKRDRRWVWGLAAAVPAAAVALLLWLNSGSPAANDKKLIADQDPPKVEKRNPVVQKDDTPKQPEVIPSPDKPIIDDKPEDKGPVVRRPNVKRLGGAIVKTDGKLSEGGVPIPDWAGEYAEMVVEEPDEYRGSDRGVEPAVRLITPLYGNRAWLELPSTYTWHAAANALGYDVTFKNVETGKAFEVTVEGLTAKVNLAGAQPGNYRIDITPRLDPEKTRPSEVRTASYLFTLLDQGSAAKVRWALANKKKAPFTSAMILRRFGLLEEAAAIKLDASSKAWTSRILGERNERLINPLQ